MQRVFVLGLLILSINLLAQEKSYLSKDYKIYGLNPSKVETWEDGTHTNGGVRGTYEWWYFDFKFNDGTTMVIVFYTKPITKVNKKTSPFFTVEINFPNGQKIEKEWKYKASQAFYSKDSCYVKIGNSFVHGNLKNYIIKIDEKDFNLNLNLKNTAISWRPHTGHLLFGKEKFFAWVVPVPEGDASVSFRYNDKNFNLKGQGYHDHNWGNAPMFDLIHHWYWSRTQFDNYTVIAADVIANTKYGYTDFVLFSIFKDGKLVADNTDSAHFFQSVPKPVPPNKLMSNNILFKYHNGPVAYELELKNGQLISKAQLVEKTVSFKPWAFVVENIFGFKPSYYRMTGTGQLIYIKDNCIKEQLTTNNAIWEMMYFGDPGK